MKDVRQTYFQITGVRAKTIEPLYGGLNSMNYLVDGSRVLRIKLPGIDTRYSPKNEYVAERLAAPTGLVPKLLHFDQTSGVKLTEFIPDTKFLSKPVTKDEIELVAIALRSLHKIHPANLSKFDPLERYRLYKDAAKLETSFPHEEQILSHIKDLLTRDTLVFAHNDLVRGNLLFKQHRVYVIDYEYSGVNHPLFDLASFITENNIDDQQSIDAFLAAYYQQKNIPRRDFAIFCRFLDYLWYYWAQGMFLTTGQSIYKTIARMKWLRISAT
ncbi:MAG TPA: choline/ethanolamine kinase family protein [Bacilli bacterium]|nr:choline/ethanolamine kinase family protein [Bacilli bacterium]